MKRFYKYAILFMTVVLLAACSASEEEALTETETAVQEVLKADTLARNKEKDAFEYYMPIEFSIVEQDDYNIVFSKGKTNIILFVNPNENAKSDNLYKEAAEDRNVILDKTWEEGEQLAYLIVDSLKEEKYELVVGVGGVKLTAETTASDMVADAKLMMQVAESVVIKDQPSEQNNPTESKTESNA
ncbi:hypothetical protein LC040_13390 [Bacillus tianshenii]|nr:hypothetical protein LC040_13390 [Bacillus tianshenii]